MTKKKLQILLCIFIFTTGAGAGYYIGVKNGKAQTPAQQTNIQIKDIKTKNGGTINLDTSTQQEQDNSKKKEKKKFLGIF